MDTNEIITAVTERVREAANVTAVFGEPIETGGVTIIPVATVKVSGGGGGGRGRMQRRREEEEEPAGNEGGMGLGLQVAAKPLGYIEVKEGAAKFVPTPDVTKIAVGGLLMGCLLLLTANRMMRFVAMKKRWQMKKHHYHYCAR